MLCSIGRVRPDRVAQCRRRPRALDPVTSRTGGGRMRAFCIVVIIGGCLSAACQDSAAPNGGAQVLWKVASSAIGFNTPLVPAASQDRSIAYFGTADFRLRKIRGSDGQVVWDVPTGGVEGFPQWNVVLSSDVVAIDRGTNVAAFDTSTGAFRWQYLPADGDDAGYSALVANDSTIFAAGRLARTYALNSKTGVPRWVADLREGQSNIFSVNPSLSDGLLFVCTTDRNVAPSRGTFWALDAMTGDVKWNYRFLPEFAQQGSDCFGSAAFWQNLVIQPQEDGRVFAFDRQTGQVQWTAPRVHDVERSLGDRRWPAVGGSTLLVTSQANEGMIVAYDAGTGVERWRRTGFGGSLWLPVLDNDVAYVSHLWIFASYDLATGNTRWQTPQSLDDPEAPFKGSPVIAGDRIYVAGRDGSYALRR